MTTEEKAKAYDEALKRAEAAIDMAADKDLVKGVATTIFPELKESEDERIRKKIVSAMSYYRNDGCISEYEFGVCRNWLEKQKTAEGKLSNEARALGRQDVTEHPERFGLQKEQKPEEWSEDDELMRKRCIADLGYLTEYEPQYKERYDEQIDWLKSLCCQSKVEKEPEVDLEAEIDMYVDGWRESGNEYFGLVNDEGWSVTVEDIRTVARHFYELGLKARKDE